MHNTWVTVSVVVRGGGCVMVTLLVFEHPFTSFTVIVYVPAHRPVAVALLPPEGFQL